ncbi:MAG: tRNA uracil 4-sulfurtransferase ThiI [Mycoplasmoidaceae bacterium]
MNNIIYIKYGELCLKKKNRINFINKLYQNISFALKNFTLNIKKEFSSTIISDFSDEKKDDIVNILKYVPGIQYIILANKIEKDVSFLKKILLKIIDPSKTFKIKTKRLDKNFEMKSPDFNILLADYLLTSISNLKVDIHEPEQEFTIEIKIDCFIIYSRTILGIDGFPVGINGEALVLLSGGIDSPVASCLIQKKGINPNYITFITPPYTSEKALAKIRSLIKIITLDQKISKGKLFIVDFTSVVQEIMHISEESYRITLMRRAFFKIAEKIAELNKYKIIVTGESIGQVASQTLESMETISSSIKNVLVFRPLLTFNKNEIIHLAKKYNTYETSILPFPDSCSLFTPKKPVTKPNIHKVLRLEEELELLPQLIDMTINKIKKEELC